MEPLEVGARVGLLLAGGLAALLVRSLSGTEWDPVLSARRRLLFGFPVGTLFTVGLVGSFFLFVQGWWAHGSVLALPFTSWSLRYPLGMVTAPVAHQSLGHLLGNLVGFLVFGSIGEYAVSHYPTERGVAAFSSPRTNPYLRALTVPVFAAGVAVLTSVFAWGPIIGFSGVVYAAAGFALVQFPLVTVAGLLAREFLNTVLLAIRDPIITASAGSSYGSPWWADVAVQTHLLGLLLGVSLGVAVRRSRNGVDRHSPGRVFAATVLIASSLTLWALWWYDGPSSFQLFRGPGVVLVLAVAALVTLADGLRESPVEGVSAGQAAVGLVAVPVLLMGGVAVPINAGLGPPDAATGGPTVTVEGYEIGYGESVPDPRFEPLNRSGLPAPEPPTASGVIIANEGRHVWTTAISAGRLENAGRGRVIVGGLGWRETVTVDRRGWRAAGGESTFVVTATLPNRSRTTLYVSEPATANTVVDGHRLSLVPANGTFAVRAVAANGTTAPFLPASVDVPPPGETVVLGNLTVSNEESVLWVETGATRVPVFERQ
jgi:membrane associated rhomboid family serine protease